MNEMVFTVGHSTHSIEKLIELLKRHDITALCDVRSHPHSRINPQFNRDPLKNALRVAGIKYVFLGKELGARSEDKSCYLNGQVQYNLLSQTQLFQQGIGRVIEGARSYSIALMCAEKEPLECHRTILVSRILIESGMQIRHILGDGRIEEHTQTIDRLISKLRIPQSDMFRSDDQIVQEAYKRQGNEIAYREQSQETDADLMENQRVPKAVG